MSATNESQIIVYTHPDSAYSTAVKIDYNNREIPFQEIVISLHPEAIPELERITGGEHITPVIVAGKEITIGFNGIG